MTVPEDRRAEYLQVRRQAAPRIADDAEQGR
jgi:hypothetical protein